MGGKTRVDTVKELEKEYTIAKADREVLDATIKIYAKKGMTYPQTIINMRSLLKREEEDLIIRITRFKETCQHEWKFLSSGYGKEHYICEKCNEYKSE